MRRRARWLALALLLTLVIGTGLVLAGRGGGGCQLSPGACSDLDLFAPDPGGNENAEVGVPPRGGKLFGFNDDPQPPGALAGLAERLAKDAGANAFRFAVDWRLLEPQPGVWDQGAWDAYGRAYQAVLSDGLVPIVSFGFAPSWARDPGPAQACQDFAVCRYPPARSEGAAWVGFAAEVARHFPRAVLEVWNEENDVGFWNPLPDPARFALIQTLAYGAIKAVDPSMPVLAGGLASPQEPGSAFRPDTPQDIPSREFLDRAYNATPSLKGHMDGLSFHPYPGGLYLGRGSLFAKEIADVRRATAAHGDAGIPLWITETGEPTAGVAAISEDDQADLERRLYERLVTMPDVKAILIHRLLPPSREPADSPEVGYALLRSISVAPEPKPAFCEFVALAGNTYDGC